MRRVKIKTRFGTVALESDKRSEKMMDLVGNALQIAAQLVPQDKVSIEPEYIK